MKKILVLLKNPVAEYPPLMSVLLALSEMENVELTIICQSCPAIFQNQIKATWIERPLPHPGVWAKQSLLSKAYYSLKFRKAAEQISEKINPDLIWIGSAETGWLLTGSKLFDKFITIAHILELYTHKGLRHWLNKRLCKDAHAIVACEENRAWIMRAFYDLPATPHILPNKPSPKLLQQGAQLPLAQEIKAKIGRRFAVLYQGAIMKERAGFSNVAMAVDELGEDWCFVCMGKDHLGLAEQLSSTCQNFIYAGYIPAPLHLEITRLCHVGIVTYEPDSLNTIFCAPNKTWEYMAFGLPILCSDLPGLKALTSASKAGFTVDFTKPDRVKSALITMREKHVEQSMSATAYFNALDINSAIQAIVQDALQSPVRTKK